MHLFFPALPVILLLFHTVGYFFDAVLPDWTIPRFSDCPGKFLLKYFPIAGTYLPVLSVNFPQAVHFSQIPAGQHDQWQMLRIPVTVFPGFG